MIKVYGYPVEVRLVIDIYGLTVNSRFRSLREFIHMDISFVIQYCFIAWLG